MISTIYIVPFCKIGRIVSKKLENQQIEMARKRRLSWFWLRLLMKSTINAVLITTRDVCKANEKGNEEWKSIVYLRLNTGL